MQRWLVVALLLFYSGTVFANTTAANLLERCQNVGNALKGNKYNPKQPNSIYAAGQCDGYINGWLDGIDGSIIQRGGSLVIVSIKRNELPDTWKIAEALQQHLQQVPLDSGKSADTVLQIIFQANNLFSFKIFTPPQEQ